MTRIRQFFRAFFAVVTEKDRDFVKKHLSKSGEKLFFEMAVFDQYHALAVAKTIANFNYLGDREFLIRLALLHDVGRRNTSIFDKVFAVLFNAVSKKFALFLSKYFRFLYVYYNHPQIGANLLKNAGFAKEAEIICHHHENVENPSIELMLLKQADDMN